MIGNQTHGLNIDFYSAETETGPVPAGDELAAGWRADGLNVVVLQPHALRRQFVQCGGLNGWVVVADVIETLESKDGILLNVLLFTCWREVQPRPSSPPYCLFNFIR